MKRVSATANYEWFSLNYGRFDEDSLEKKKSKIWILANKIRGNKYVCAYYGEVGHSKQHYYEIVGYQISGIS